MWHEFVADDKFFEVLNAEDARIAAGVKAEGCLHCGGRLDRADFPRKARGGIVAIAGERVCRRISLCCGRDGCRRRSTPASLVFLGRRVYLAIVVIVASMRAGATPTEPPPPRTRRRWLAWFRRELPRTATFTVARARLWPPIVDGGELPGALVDRFGAAGAGARDALIAALRLLAPLGASPALRDAGFARDT